MSKNAKIAIIVAVVALIALIVVLSSTVFVVKKAEIVWYKDVSQNLSQIDNDTILEKSGVQSQSVFFLDRDKAIQSLELSYPEIRVINIEVVWPNTLKIHAVEREPVYCLRVSDDKYAIVDEYFKVLSVEDSFDNTQTNATLIDTDATQNLNVVRGDDINIFGATVWSDIYYAFAEMERDIVDFHAIVKTAQLSETTMTIFTHQGTKIILDKPFANTRAKMRAGLGVFDTLTTDDYPGSVIQVFVNNDNELEARYYTE